MAVEPRKLLQNRLDIHDRKQFELKLEYQPSGRDPKSEYRFEMFMFLPASLNIGSENYPRQSFYSDIHNYVRLKTPVLNLGEILRAEASPLVRMERLLESNRVATSQPELVYQAKLLSCVFRGALRRFSSGIDERCGPLASDSPPSPEWVEQQIRDVKEGTQQMLKRFRRLPERVAALAGIEEKTRASLRLVDEYMSLTVEQFFRKAVTEMDGMPRSGLWVELRKELMGELIAEESYRRSRGLKSVISPTGDNEEYLHRFGFLKKFCMNILFLKVRREQKRQGWEEVLFAIAAGIAMAFATTIAFWAQLRFAQISLNFFLIVVVSYMMKDRIKEGMRKIFSRLASRYLFDRATLIADPVTNERLGVCKEKVDYVRAEQVPEEIQALRRSDDFVTVSQGELAEVLIRYQKEIRIDAEVLPKMTAQSPGVTDIIRINVDRLLRDMDEPEYALEYVDLEEFTIGRIRGAKSYQVDVAFRFTFDDAQEKGRTVELVRLVLDRNGIKRMLRLDPRQQPPSGTPLQSAA